MGTANFYYENTLGVVAPEAEQDDFYNEEIEFAKNHVLDQIDLLYKDHKRISVDAKDKYINSRISRNFGGHIFAELTIEVWVNSVVTIQLTQYHGYYSHANIDYHVITDSWDERTDENLLNHPSTKKAIREVKKAILNATTQYTKAYQFSNGETGYTKKQN
jgi:hypothetical protein